MQAVAGAGLVPASGSGLPSFRLVQPRSVEAAVQALADADRPLLLAGGTDLVAAFNEGATASDLIDLSKIGPLARIKASDRGLSIGATVTHHAGSRDGQVLARAPGFAAAWARIANPRIRFSATLGGNLMARRVRYEGSVLLSALDARLHFASAAGAAELAPADLWAGLAPKRSLLHSIEIATADLQWFGYERSLRPLLTIATALRRTGSGTALCCAVATEYLRPVTLRVALSRFDTLADAANARAVAEDLFSGLPADFVDPVVTVAYARAAGATLLARQLQGAALG